MDFKDRISYEWNKPDNTLMRVIMINVAIYIVMVLITILARFAGLNALYTFIAEAFFLPPNILEFVYKPWTILTYGFFHSTNGFGGLLHILFNMLILYWFGQIVVSEIGSNRLLGIHIWGILIGGIAFLLIYNLVPYFIALQNATTGLLGASAGVYAVVVAAASLLPNLKMRLFLLGDVKLKWIATGYIILSIIGLGGGNAGGDMSHLGGALMGYIFIWQYRRGNDWSKPITSVVRFVGNIFKKKPKMKKRKGQASEAGASRPTGQAGASKSNQEQETIDRILDKISESGYESLTKQEKQILFKASKN